jgi:hypothetical protein
MRGYELFGNTKIVFETPDDGYSYFFGYYDKPSLSMDGKRLLSHRVRFDGRMPTEEDMAEVGFFDLESGKFTKVGETGAWNWQQGSHLQWMPPEYNDRIIYNSRGKDGFTSIVYDVKSGTSKTLPRPIYAIHPKGEEALCIEYERLYWCRPGYNYMGVENEKWNRPWHEEDGIFKMDLRTGETTKIVGMKEVVSNKHLEEFDRCDNWLEHIQYSPSGERFMFFHRWRAEGKDMTRLYTAYSESGGDLNGYPDIRFYSHSYWRDDDTLTIWSRDFSSLDKSIPQRLDRMKKSGIAKRVLRPIYKKLEPFLPYRVVKELKATGVVYNLHMQNGEYEKIGEGILDKVALNGHFIWMDEETMLTDTYADEGGYRRLYLYDTEKGYREVARFASIYDDTGYRADLHPRKSADGRLVTIDTLHTGSRKQMILEFDYNV